MCTKLKTARPDIEQYRVASFFSSSEVTGMEWAAVSPCMQCEARHSCNVPLKFALGTLLLVMVALGTVPAVTALAEYVTFKTGTSDEVASTGRWKMLVRAAAFEAPGRVLAPVTREHAEAIVMAATAVSEAQMETVYERINAFDYIGAGFALNEIAETNSETVYASMLTNAVARFVFGTKQAIGEVAYSSLMKAEECLSRPLTNPQAVKVLSVSNEPASIRRPSHNVFISSSADLTRGVYKLKLAGEQINAERTAIDEALVAHMSDHEGTQDLLVARTYFDMRQKAMVAMSAEFYVSQLAQKTSDKSVRNVRPASSIERFIRKGDLYASLYPVEGVLALASIGTGRAGANPGRPASLFRSIRSGKAGAHPA